VTIKFNRHNEKIQNRIVVSALMLLFMSGDALALTYYLQQDLGVNGTMHYCKYNNGKVYTVDAVLA
jgi:hypothetical protein